MADRTCTRCERVLPVEEFARDASKASGHKSLCKACDRVKSKAYYAANREAKLAKLEQERRAAGIPRRGSGERRRYHPRQESSA
jgi:hypothetical protein